jgi:hypothetical protein
VFAPQGPEPPPPLPFSYLTKNYLCGRRSFYQIYFFVIFYYYFFSRLYTLFKLTYWNGEQESIWIPNFAEDKREREMNRQIEEERERQMDRQTNVSLLKSNVTSMQR